MDAPSPEPEEKVQSLGKGRKPSVLTGNVPEVVIFLKTNVIRARRIGNVCVVATLLIGIAILGAFLAFSQAATQQRYERDEKMFGYLDNRRQEAREKILSDIEETAAAIAKIEDKSVLQRAQSKFDELISAFNRAMPPNYDTERGNNLADEIVYNFTSSVIRIGAVLIGIYLIQIMVTFARYYYKLAEHLAMAAALIDLSGGKLLDLKVITPLLLPSKIDFGKAPTSPVENVLEGALEAIKEIAKKVPSR